MDSHEAKRLKKIQLSLLELANDELFVITSYLFAGETIMLAMSCRSLYNIVKEMMEIAQPKVLGKWSLRDALLVRDRGLKIRTLDHLYLMRNILSRNGQFHSICTNGRVSLDFSRYKFDSEANEDKPTLRFSELCTHFSEFCNLFVGRLEGTVTVPTSSNTTCELRVLTGHTIVHLSLTNVHLYVTQLLTCIQSMINLETLELSNISSDQEELRDQVLPQLVHLKKFISHKSDLNVVMPMLLQCMPNLEQLSYVAKEFHVSTFLTQLCHTNPRLTELKTHAYIQEEVLHSLAPLPITHLNVSRLCMNEIGQIGWQLEKLVFDCGNGPIFMEKLWFGPNVMPSLKSLKLKGQWSGYLDTDIFVDSLILAAPNLQEFILEHADLSSHRVMKIVNTFDLVKLQVQVEQKDMCDVLIALQQKKNLLELCITGARFTAKEFERCCFPSVRVFCGTLPITKFMFDLLHKTFPNLVKLVVNPQTEKPKIKIPYNQDDLCFLTSSYWPSLQQLQVGKQHCVLDMRTEEQGLIHECDSKQVFLRDWFLYCPNERKIMHKQLLIFFTK
jgi:hypothetical protein